MTRARTAPPPGVLLRRLWHVLPPARRSACMAAMLLTTTCVLAEVGTLEALRRLLLQATQAPDSFAVLRGPLALFLGAGAILTLLRLATLHRSDRVLLLIAGDLGVRLFRGAIRQPHGAQHQRQTAELFSGLDKTQQLTNGVLAPLQVLATNLLVAPALFLYLVWVAPWLTLGGGLVLGLLYAWIGRTTRPRLERASANVAGRASQRMKAAHEAQSGYRDIVLNQAQALAEREFEGLERSFRRSQGDSRFLALAPRYVVELVVLLLIAVAVVVLTSSQTALASMVPLAGTLAVGAQRLLPILNLAHTAWSQLLGGAALLDDVLTLIERPLLPLPAADALPLPFERELSLHAVALRYPGRQPVLTGVDLTLARGERLGIVGGTGAGKSSLLDVLLGLMPPSAGELRVDGIVLESDALRARWQAAVALVPQSIYLPDRPLRELIVYPDDPATADPARLQAALTGARLDAFVASLPHGLETSPGDRGLRLSGGQRQRIALARALYRRPRLLVLDEATGQLDATTEREVVDALDALGRDTTLVFVSHRRSALRGCDRVVELRDGVLHPLAAKLEAAS